MALERWRPFGWGLRRWLPARTLEEEMDEMLDRFERILYSVYQCAVLLLRHEDGFPLWT